MMRGASGAPLPAGQIFGENDELLGVGMTAGDWNGDGYSDFALSGPNFDAPGLNAAGRVRVYNGSGSWPDQLPDWEVRGTRVTQLFGRSIANAGDVNGDGFDDLLIHSWLSPTGNNRGQVELYLGSTNGLGGDPCLVTRWRIRQSGLRNGPRLLRRHRRRWLRRRRHHLGEAQQRFDRRSGADLPRRPERTRGHTPSDLFIGAPTDLYFGGALASAGDVNNDGRSDLLIGTSNYSTGHAGHAELLMGGTSGSSLTLVWTSSTNNCADRLEPA
ncbi:MAG: VCBS repeat-containing protein [Candidatus Eisenbacteria bacterium]